LSSSETDENIYLQYGPGLKELVDLHTQEGYSRPYLSSYVNIYGNQVVACVSVEKYVEEGETSKQMIAKESTYFRVQFQRLPLVNIDLLKRVIPEN
tara:strand:- start:34 stop:321 length:288 start_codon:yes stop_codon:yes gene_type:complete